jgi:hypothetical protein
VFSFQDLLDIHELIAVKYENERRASDAAQQRSEMQ